MAKTRTFVAVALSEEVRGRAAALIDQMQARGLDVRWTRPENLHFTLQFLGDVAQNDIAAVCDHVIEGAAALEPFELVSRGVGAFPSPERPRTLWLGATAGGQQMVALQEAIELSLADLGFRGEQRRYVPHVTLGRAGRSRKIDRLVQAMQELADYEAGTMVVEEVIVYGSQLTPEGPQYHVLGRAGLSG